MDTDSLLTSEQLQALRQSISSHAPFCSGVLPVSNPVDLALYYGKGENARWIDLYRPSNESISNLVNACEPATFGFKGEDVYDECYRKAGKLDCTSFRPMLDISSLGLVEIVRDGLLHGMEAQKPIRAELYNLNVYGEGSFFKAHRDTPHGQKMFGSLVIFYPTSHQGGRLHIRKDDKEWYFDSEILTETEEPHIGYVALYSDVEHEVDLVKSGHRVSITYNLFYESDHFVQHPTSLSPNALAFKNLLQGLLDDPTFLPDGGWLGFGLEYHYPLPTATKHIKLDKISNNLKGSDAEIMQVAEQLGLNASLWCLVESARAKVACKGILPDISGMEFGENTIALDSFLREEVGAKMLQESEEGEVDERCYINWVTRPTGTNRTRTAYLYYGNETTSEYAYNTVCLVIRVEKRGQNQTQNPSD
ncbi:hypothetical protein F5887DRAFT_984695 [Amanita rubescens]|nr:hypothetical protein F5887DRAFT_984695 [Amanita rubescens]